MKDTPQKIEEKIEEILKRPMKLDFIPQYRENLKEMYEFGLQAGRQQREDIETELKRLYESEINVTISSFWDGGWSVALGDHRPPWDYCDLDEIVPALRELALKHYPNSVYSKNIDQPNKTQDGVQDGTQDTLSSLIEQCGDECDDFALFFIGNVWVCGDYMPFEGDWIIRAEGSTPEEAVRNLLNQLKK